MSNLVFVAAAMLITVGLYAAMTRRNLIKIVMAVSVVGSGVNLFLVGTGYRENSIAPIFTNAPSLAMVMPTPQALTLTSIVINLAIVAMMLSFAMKIYQHYGTLDSRERRLKK